MINIEINFNDEFNNDITNLKYNKLLEKIKFGFEFNKRIFILKQFSFLRILVFGHCFNSDIDCIKNLLILQEITFGENFNKDIIGTLQLTFIPYLTYRGGLRAQIEAVRIHKKLRGKGFGKKIFKWAIKRSRDRGAHLVQLTTDIFTISGKSLSSAFLNIKSMLLCIIKPNHYHKINTQIWSLIHKDISLLNNTHYGNNKLIIFEPIPEF